MANDGTHTGTSEISNSKSPQPSPRVSPAKIYHHGYGMRVDQLHQFATAIADGALTVEQLAPQMPPPLYQAVCALAAEIAAARIPLVAIGPDWRFPSAANYLPADPPEPILTTDKPASHFSPNAPYDCGESMPLRSAWSIVLARVGYVAFGLGMGMALARWVYS